MNERKRLSASQQLLLTFGTLCAILLTIGGLLFFGLRSIEQKNQLQQSRALNKLALIDDTAQDIGQMQAGVLRQVLASDPSEIKSLDQTVRDTEKINFKELTDYQKYLDTERENQLYDKVMQARKAYWEQTQPVLAFGHANRDAEAQQLINSKQAPAYDELLNALNDLINCVEANANQLAEATSGFIFKIRIIGDALAGIALFIAAGTGFSVARITLQLKEDNVALQTEIAERKLAEERIERLRNEHKIILNSVSEGVHWIDVDGQVKFENPAAIKMLGYETDELIGKPAHLTMHHSHADGSIYPATECPIYATMKDGALRRVKDEVFWRKDGTSFPVEYTSTPIRDENNDLAGSVVVFTDVTERNRIEARMFQSQKMETVGKLAGGVAHEFNSILTAIIGQTELLLSDLPPDNPLGKNAREIRQAADRAATLTRQLLAYGRKQILQPEILDLNRVLTDMVSTLQHLMGREVDVRIVPSLGLKTVKIDPGQMEQVIVNIAINAADAMPNGGQLTLETANVTLDEDYVRAIPGLKAGGYVMLAITDTGIGMSEAVKARIFEPFFSTKGVGQGTGLGLATCYGILKQSDGHINVYSEVARGATFKIYLPQVGKQTTSPLSRLTSPGLPRGTETILLAEDDPSLLEMSTTLLRRLGYTVLTAVNGVEALNLKNQRDIGHIDLLFTDVVMPHMSGKELSDRIRMIYPRTKILFTSAYTESAIVHQGILNEGVMLLQKPFTPSALARKVREVLDQ
jgi:two-component system, cell cycle sensor histidine kinase and response regulator CckA